MRLNMPSNVKKITFGKEKTLLIPLQMRNTILFKMLLLATSLVNNQTQTHTASNFLFLLVKEPVNRIF